MGKTIEQSLLEVMEEEELANLRSQQREFEELRNAELVEQQRLEEQERRIREEKVAHSEVCFVWSPNIHSAFVVVAGSPNETTTRHLAEGTRNFRENCSPCLCPELPLRSCAFRVRNTRRQWLFLRPGRARFATFSSYSSCSSLFVVNESLNTTYLQTSNKDSCLGSCRKSKRNCLGQVLAASSSMVLFAKSSSSDQRSTQRWKLKKTQSSKLYIHNHQNQNWKKRARKNKPG